ncbi:MAG: NAD-dependent epimerase [Pseudomonadota bacterium]
MKILVTGTAGFIGFHLARRFCERGDDVVGIDNLNDYYDVALKEARLSELKPFKNFRFVRMDICDEAAMVRLFDESSFDRIIHMAAQAGVRYSIENPHAYVQSNLVGFMNVLEGCRAHWAGRKMGHLVYASSSSVYGLNTKLPFSVRDNVDHPISLYGATKKANELMAHTYSYLYGIPATGLRFFTVYGPWGRPDMALFKFTKSILEGQSIDVYNNGKMKRDFTYIDDIVEGVARVADHIPQHSPLLCKEGMGEVDPAFTPAPYKLYNIGNHSPIELLDFIKAIEEATGRKVKINFLPMQPGDVPATYADVDDLSRDVGFAPKTPVKEGIRRFVEWYQSYYS